MSAVEIELYIPPPDENIAAFCDYLQKTIAAEIGLPPGFFADELWPEEQSFAE